MELFVDEKLPQKDWETFSSSTRKVLGKTAFCSPIAPHKADDRNNLCCWLILLLLKVKVSSPFPIENTSLVYSNTHPLSKILICVAITHRNFLLKSLHTCSRLFESLALYLTAGIEVSLADVNHLYFFGKKKKKLKKSSPKELISAWD